MTKKKVIKADDGHKHYWEPQYSRSSGKKIPLGRWICRRCTQETTQDPFQEGAR